MAKSFLGNVTFPLNFNVEKTAPLDDRLVVDEKSNLYDGSLGDYVYVGMIVAVKGDSSLYVLTSLPATTESNWSEIKNASDVSDEITGVKSEIEKSIAGIQSRISTNESNHEQDIKGVQGQIDSLIKKHNDEVDGIQSRIGTEVGNLNTTITNTKSELEGKIKSLGDSIDELESKHDDDIEEINTTIDGLKTKHGQDISGVQTELKEYVDDVKKTILGEGVTEAFDTLKEVEDWIKTHGTQASDLITQVKGIQDTLIPGVQGELYGIQSKILENIESINEDISGVQIRIDELEEKHDKGIQGVQGQITDSMKYQTSAKEGWTTEHVGGIESGTSYTQFTGDNQKTISEVLDDILFPTYDNIVIEQPSAGVISINPTLYEVGTDTIPSEDVIIKSENSRGVLKYNTKDKNTNYAGIVSQDVTNPSSGVWGGELEEKTYTVTRAVKFEAGVKPLNNKGEDDNKLPAFSDVDKEYTETCTFTGVYPIYTNNLNISSVSKLELVDYTVDGGAEIIMNIPSETDSKKWEVHVPEHLTIMSKNQWNPSSGDYNASTTLVENGTVEHNDIVYKIYVRTKTTTDKQGASQYRIVVKK